MEQAELIHAIRNRLRLAMNGVVAASMREKGMHYKLIFGVSLPELQQIAGLFRGEASAELAEALWKEDVRELKILATMLYPADLFTHERAETWVADVPYPEIAEQLARNLLWKTAEADEMAVHLLYDRQHAYARTCAFLVFVYLFTAGRPVEAAHLNAFWVEAVRTLASRTFGAAAYEKRAALTALKRYGRQSGEQAKRVLGEFARFKDSADAEEREMYHDLEFELAFFSPGFQIQINALPLSACENFTG